MNRDLTLGEQVIRNPLIRDKILSHFNPYDIALTASLRASPMIGSLAHSLTRSLAHSLTRSLTHHPQVQPERPAARDGAPLLLQAAARH